MMRLPMAYIFLIIANEENTNVNSELAATNDNLTYRLMEFEQKKENGKHHQSDEMSADASPENSNYPAHIVPRRRSPSYQSQEVDVNVRKEVLTVRENRSQPVHPKPKDKNLGEFEEEIAKFRIASRAPKQLKKKFPKKEKRQEPNAAVKKENQKKKANKKSKKPKPVLEELDEAMKLDFDDDDGGSDMPGQDGVHEEEEETKEKKEKVHKVTIKKKLPRKNVTGIIRHQRQQPYQMNQLPYKTIIEEERIVTRQRKPSPPQMLKVDSKPLVLKEDVENINPNFYYDKNVRKGVKPRDVNIYLRTPNKNPKILIRRYKPFFSVVNIPIIKNGYAAGLKKDRRKQRRKQRRRRKKLRKQRERDDEDFSPESSRVANQVSCSTERVPERFANSNSFPVFGALGSGGGAGNNGGGGSGSPYASIYNSFPTIRPESIILPDENVPFPDEYQHQYPTGSFSAIQQLTTARPVSAIKSAKVVADDDEPIETAYDMNEHKRTAALAAVHEKETDDTVDNEEEEPQFDEEANAAVANDPAAEADDGENAETAADVNAPDYENDEQESSPEWKLFYGYQPQKLVKKKIPITKPHLF